MTEHSKEQEYVMLKNIKVMEMHSLPPRVLFCSFAASTAVGYAVLPPACGILQHVAVSRFRVTSQTKTDCRRQKESETKSWQRRTTGDKLKPKAGCYLTTDNQNHDLF